MHSGGSSSKIGGIVLAAALSAALAARAAEPPPAAQPAPAARKVWETLTIPLPELQAAAQRGDADAQYELGMRSHDRAVAVGWFRKAAEQGHAEAQYMLGEAYWLGSGVARDAAEAARWWLRAAEQGQAHAECHLGWVHEHGWSGLPKDAVEAMRWYRRAAEHDDAEAQARLGSAYALGQGVPHDDREAVAWYRRAAAQNDPLGQVGLGQMVAAGRGVAKDEQEAAKWYERAAHQNVATAMALLGEAYADGRGVQPDLPRAYYWLSLAAKLDVSDFVQTRDEVGRKLPPRELAEAKRMLATATSPAGDLILAPLVSGPAAMPKPGEVCSSLARVMAAAEANFAALRGKAREKGGWDTTEALPGMRHCGIDESENGSRYRCAVSQGDDAAVAGTDLESTRRLLSSCLGESWRSDEERYADRRITVFFVRKRSEPLLKITSTKSLHTYEVELAVAPPLPSMTVKESPPGKTIDLDAPTDIKATEAAAWEVFDSLHETVAVSLVFGHGVKGRVTLVRQDMPLHEVLDAVCAQVGCAWFLDTKGPIPELYVKSKAGNLDEPIVMKVTAAASGEVFTSIGGVLAAEVNIDSDVTGRVTLDREDMPVHEVLDAVCAQVGCVWSLDTTGPKPRLFIHRKESAGHRRQ